MKGGKGGKGGAAALVMERWREGVIFDACAPDPPW